MRTGTDMRRLAELRRRLRDKKARQTVYANSAEMRQAAPKTAGMGTWNRVLNDVQTEFMAEVGTAAHSLLVDEGAEHVKVATRGSSVLLTGVMDDQPLSIRYFWKEATTIGGEITLGSTRRASSEVVLSMDPHMIAGEFIYAHRKGVLP